MEGERKKEEEEALSIDFSWTHICLIYAYEHIYWKHILLF